MKKSILLLVFAALLAVFLTAFYLKNFKGSGLTSGPAVITQLQKLSRYETASFTIEKIIESGSKQNSVINSFLFGDKILLIANGEVIAGLDLSELEDNDIKITGKSITLNLPKPKIFITALNQENTKVYDRTQGLLTKGNQNLETEARIEAESSIKEAACEGGILNQANKNARDQLTALLKSLGFETVNIVLQEGSC